jgi:hypothetical protein
MLPRPTVPPGYPDELAGRFMLHPHWKCYIGRRRWLVLGANGESDGLTIIGGKAAKQAVEYVLGERYQYAHDYLGPVVAHDGLYGGRLLLPDYLAAGMPQDQAEREARREADGIFYQLLRANGVSNWRARLMLEAVDKLGWAVWNRHTPESIAQWRAVCKIFRDDTQAAT